MLAESILTGIAYKEEIYKSHKCQVLKGVGEDAWGNPHTGVNCNSRSKCEKHMAKKIQETCEIAIDKEVCLGSSAQKSSMNGYGDNPLLASQSAPLCIPRREPHCEKELDLYRSWSSQSLYQQYPDLYIGGDHIADHRCDSGCIMDQAYDDLTNGPILFSEDIPLGQSPLTEPLQKCKAAKLWTGDEVAERSITLHRQPLSNSMINNYMEKKVQELYKQFLDEKLTRCNSITHVLTSNLLCHIGEVSRQLSCEQQVEAVTARKTLFHSLAVFGLQDTSDRNSCECSTPNLQISELPCKMSHSVMQHAS
ncbi:TLR adapter interacting with SLC15A4 on the lysosome-like [Eublepharis macularius]|uniref:TLR adapter interacting with SLC15A4 on the lysosome-like n=1 Tax=Eublepharis macularius TaxID=481883 RepID=A0AA97K9L2_EUBMA|nr:TLR adapter interacting with SLC15A4 on the lysosome-like [Eublepharis macularius]